MAVTAAPSGRVPVYVDVEQGKTKGRHWQAWISISFNVEQIFIRINQQELRIHCRAPYSAARVRPTRWPEDHCEAVPRRLSTTG